MASPFDQILLPYQRAWVHDGSRFKIGMWSRQTGKSFATACEAVMDCLVRPGQLWVCLSAGERQAFEWLRKAKQCVDAAGVAVKYAEMPNAADARFSKGEIQFANKSRIVAIPANPDTARGYSANLVLDEFAIHENSWDIWAAIFPSISNPLSGEKKLRIVSTPKGLGNKFADLWQKNDAYSKHKITIEDAAAAGLGVDIPALRQGVDDADVWAQEYMCEFIDSSGVLLPYEMIQACTLPEEPEWAQEGAPRYIGMDVGRSHDLSVLVEAERLTDGTLRVVELECLAKMEFHHQLEILVDRARDPAVRRVCVDATGIGAMLAEEARRMAGGKVEPVQFTAATKADLYTGMRRAFEDRTVRIPPDRDLREDLHAVERRVSQGGGISYAAPRNADGHSDRAAALALAIRAASSRGTWFPPLTLGRRRNPDLRRY